MSRKNTDLLSESELEPALRSFLQLLASLVTTDEMGYASRHGANFRNDVFVMNCSSNECSCGAGDDDCAGKMVTHAVDCRCVQPNFHWLNGDNFMVTWHDGKIHNLVFPRLSRAEFHRMVKECIASLNL